MACGVPVVLSDVGVNREIIQNGGNGFLAGNDNDWLFILEKLITDASLRKIIGEKGNATVIEKYSVAANKEKYLNIFKNAQ